MTRDHILFFVHPVGVRLLPVLLGLQAPARALTWHPEQGSVVLIVDKADPSRVRRISCDPFFHMHFVNAYEESGRFIVDYCRYERFAMGDAFLLSRLRDGSAFTDLDEAGLTRAVIDAEDGTIEAQALAEGLIDFGTTAAHVQSAPYRFAYAIQTEPHRDLVVKFDWVSEAHQRVHLGKHLFPGEVTFCPRPDGDGEDDGWLLSLVYDASEHRSGLCIMDAKDFERAPLAWLWFNHHIPFPLHGCWLPATGSC